MSLIKKLIAENATVSAAFNLASKAHADQKRKYTHTPYIDHCVEVANLVAAAGSSPEVIAAALLHDTVEDTAVTREDIAYELSSWVADLVMMVTDVSRPEDGNRKARKAKDLAHLAEADADGQTIKLADIISNSVNILGNDQAFCKIYIPEMLSCLSVLTKGNAELYTLASNYVNNGKAHLEFIGALK